MLVRPAARATAVLVAVALLTSCGDDEVRIDDPVQTPEVSMSESPETPPAQSRSGVVEQAIEDLAARVSAPADQVEVVSEEEVTWRNGSLGCEEKGMSYTQALVDGRRIVLRVDGKDYEYHSGRSGAPFYCAKPTE